MAWVFPSSSNRPLFFKAHACTGGISRGRFQANLLAQRHNPLNMLSRTKGSFFVSWKHNYSNHYVLFLFIQDVISKFFPSKPSLLPNIMPEAHANLKKNKTSYNTTLKHYAFMVIYISLERSSLSSLICQSVVFFSIYSSSKFIWAVVHYYIVHIFPRQLN